MESFHELVEREIEIPEFQRALDEERVEEIVRYQMDERKKNGCFCFVGCLTLCHDRSHTYLVDGMHRLAAVRRLCGIDPDHQLMVQHVDLCRSRMCMTDVFFQINVARPMEAYVIDTLCDRQKRRVMEDVRAQLFVAYRPFFSKSDRPRPPNVNLPLLLQTVCSPAVMKAARNNASHIVGFVEWANAQMVDWVDAGTAEKIRTKADSCGTKHCYLAASPEWAHAESWERWHEVFVSTDGKGRIERANANKKNNNRRGGGKATISKSLRNKVWNTYIGEDRIKGPCASCGEQVHFQNWEAGHVVAECNGGKTELGNLRPVCSVCNKSMGSKNMDEFKKRFRADSDAPSGSGGGGGVHQ